MLVFKLYKIMVNKVTFVGFRGGDRPNRPPWIHPCYEVARKMKRCQRFVALHLPICWQMKQIDSLVKKGCGPLVMWHLFLNQ